MSSGFKSSSLDSRAAPNRVSYSKPWQLWVPQKRRKGPTGGAGWHPQPPHPIRVPGLSPSSPAPLPNSLNHNPLIPDSTIPHPRPPWFSMDSVCSITLYLIPTQPFQTLISEASFSSLALFPKPRLSLPPSFLKDLGAEEIRYAVLYWESCLLKIKCGINGRPDAERNKRGGWEMLIS